MLKNVLRLKRVRTLIMLGQQLFEQRLIVLALMQWQSKAIVFGRDHVTQGEVTFSQFLSGLMLRIVDISHTT